MVVMTSYLILLKVPGYECKSEFIKNPLRLIWILQLGMAYWNTQHHRVAPNPPKSPATTQELPAFKNPVMDEHRECVQLTKTVFVTGVAHPQAVQASRSWAAEGADAVGKLTSTPSTALPWQGLFCLGACGRWFVCLCFSLLVSFCLGFFCGRVSGFCC